MTKEARVVSANIVSVDEESLRKDINNLVRKTVEETLNALLDEETSELVGAERYRRRETSVEEAIIELYLVGVSTRRIEDVSELLWGRQCPPALSPTSTSGPPRPSEPGGRGRSMAAIPSLSSTASASSAAGEDPARTRPCRPPSASTPSAAGRSSAAPRIHRVGGLLVRVLLPAQGARALRRAARHRRQVRVDARCARGGVPRGPLQRCTVHF